MVFDDMMRSFLLPWLWIKKPIVHYRRSKNRGVLVAKELLKMNEAVGLGWRRGGWLSLGASICREAR